MVCLTAVSRATSGGPSRKREDDVVSSPTEASLEVRPPLQRRSREAWNRVLDAGVALLEDGGYDAFTIAAVCERAGVAPRALYARVDTKDVLLLAVHGHGVARLLAGQEVSADTERWAELAPADLVRAAVAEAVGISLRTRSSCARSCSSRPRTPRSVSAVPATARRSETVLRRSCSERAR